MYCDYGCGQIYQVTLKNGKNCCSIRPSGCSVLKKMNSEGAKKAYSSGERIPQPEVYKNLPEETKKRMNWNKDNFSKTRFEYGGTGNHKRVLIQERGHKCEDCELEYWKSKKIPLELEHIDGNNRNNDKSNLKLLCCNCHALTDTWRGKNINSGKVKVTDDELLIALKECSNIRQALMQVGLTPKGGNYNRANKLKATLVK
jgi:hypothetical protein